MTKLSGIQEYQEVIKDFLIGKTFMYLGRQFCVAEHISPQATIKADYLNNDGEVKLYRFTPQQLAAIHESPARHKQFQPGGDDPSSAC